MPKRKGSPIIEVEPEDKEEMEKLSDIAGKELERYRITKRVVEELEKAIEKVPTVKELREELEKGDVWITIIPAKEEKKGEEK